MTDDNSKTNPAYMNTISYANIATENICEGNQLA